MKNKLTLKTSLRLSAPISKVWQILTNPVCIKQFYFDMDWETDWKKGSPIIVSGTWDREYFEDKGNVLEIDPEKFILFNLWISASGKEDKPENYVTIRYELESINNHTRLTIYQYDLENEALLMATQPKWENVLQGVKQLVEK